MNFSSVEKVKQIASQIGWNGQKTEKDRKFLSDLKRLTTEYNDMSFKSIEKVVKEFLNSSSEILLIHIREPEEIERAVKTFHAKTLLVKRVGLANITTNYSDVSVENYNYDYIIENTTLENLKEQAHQLINELRLANTSSETKNYQKTLSNI